MLLTCKRLVRKMLGVESLARRITDTGNRTQQGLLALGNALHSARLTPEARLGAADYRRCAEVVALLRPCRVDGVGFVRVGGHHDGGYVMLDDFGPSGVGAAYGCGVGDEVSWEFAMAERGFDVFLYDHTVARPPVSHPRFRFSRTGLCGHPAVANCATLDALVAANGHENRRDLILKMDVEGAEWATLAAASEETLARFRQIVVEFHDLGDAIDPARRGPLLEVLAKLRRTHQSVHVHGNCTQLPVWIGDLVLPRVLEVTYVRREDHAGRFTPRDESFPTELDEPNLPGWPDIHLGRFGLPATDGTGS